MPPKSIFRQPGAKHFQLVHRSQRDPLIHDPDATVHVLKQVVRENDKKGKTRAELEAILSVEEVAQESDKKAGEAAQYGIYYDDTEYDYMQHLRPVGVQEDGVDSILVEAPSTSKKSDKKSPLALRDLPKGVLPSSSELPRTYESQQDVPDSISGFQPDMDPHLRQALEALEDDAFVDDGLEDDFFGELVGDGERDGDGDIEFPFSENGVIDGTASSHEPSSDVQEDEDDTSWEARFARFKQTQGSAPQSDDGEDESEGGDTVSGLPNISVIGGKGKKRRKGSSEASGYSMSSSSMFRNEALQTLDERFDQVMLKQYNDEEDDLSMPDDSDSDSEAPELITSRDDFASMMNEFLDDYEILGRKMKPKLAGDSGTEKLDTLRRAMGQDQRVRESYDDEEDTPDEDLFLELEEDKKDRWDCETILSTYTNLENHPRLIRARNPRPVPQIVLDPKTGLPSVVQPQVTKRAKPTQTVVADGTRTNPRPETIARPRDESPESKKARKAAVKLERATRRAEKKVTKEEFGSEFKMQTKMQHSKLAMRKL